MRWACRSDDDCSLNGKCAAGACACRPAWKVLARVSEDLGAPMVGINCEDMTVSYAAREGGNNAAAPAAANGKSPHGTW